MYIQTWDTFWLGLAEYVSQKSKDSSTKIGAVIVRPDNTLVNFGYNGFPRGVRELRQSGYTEVGQFPGHLDPERWEKRPEKYRWVEHGERNAIYNCARLGLSTLGCKLYLNAAPLPCSDCTRSIIQAGIVEIIGLGERFRGKGEGVHYHCGEIEEQMLREAGVARRVVPRV